METSSIEQTEGSGNVNVRATLRGPTGGLGEPVTVLFTSNGHNPGDTIILNSKCYETVHCPISLFTTFQYQKSFSRGRDQMTWCSFSCLL